VYYPERILSAGTCGDEEGQGGGLREDGLMGVRAIPEDDVASQSENPSFQINPLVMLPESKSPRLNANSQLTNNQSRGLRKRK
jgi:hypothetical protein